MKHHFFMIPARDPERAAEELNRFCSQHRIVTVDKQFVVAGKNSYWSINHAAA